MADGSRRITFPVSLDINDAMAQLGKFKGQVQQAKKKIDKDPLKMNKAMGSALHAVGGAMIQPFAGGLFEGLGDRATNYLAAYGSGWASVAGIDTPEFLAQSRAQSALEPTARAFAIQGQALPRDDLERMFKETTKAFKPGEEAAQQLRQIAANEAQKAAGDQIVKAIEQGFDGFLQRFENYTYLNGP